MIFEEKYFRKIDSDVSQIQTFWRAAKKDLKIASSFDVAEIRFKFSYDGFVKLGIALIAQRGYRVRSTAGHHIKAIEATSKILKDKDINVIGDAMRQTRNNDLYQGGFGITEKESVEYLKFIKNVFEKAKGYFQ